MPLRRLGDLLSALDMECYLLGKHRIRLCWSRDADSVSAWHWSQQYEDEDQGVVHQQATSNQLKTTKQRFV